MHRLSFLSQTDLHRPDSRDATDPMRLLGEHAGDRCMGLGVIDVQAMT